MFVYKAVIVNISSVVQQDDEKATAIGSELDSLIAKVLQAHENNFMLDGFCNVGYNKEWRGGGYYVEFYVEEPIDALIAKTRDYLNEVYGIRFVVERIK